MLQPISTTNNTLRTIHHKEEVVVKPLAVIRLLDPSEYITVRKNGKQHLLRIEEILHCVGASNYSSIYHQSGFKVMVPRTIKSLATVLLPTGFLRVHRSHIIHQDAIQQVFTTHIELCNGDSVPIARRYKKTILQRLAEMATCS
jgi:two-component system LytT family response regulator